jgi:hypothetical protein
MFSRFSFHLKGNNATCRSELYKCFKNSYTPTPESFHLREIANIRDYYKNGKYLYNMYYHTKPLHFRITKFNNQDQPTIYTKMNCRQANWSDYQLQSIQPPAQVLPLVGPSIVAVPTGSGSAVNAVTSTVPILDPDLDSHNEVFTNAFDPLEIHPDGTEPAATVASELANSNSSSSLSSINFSMSTSSEVIIQDLSAPGFQLLKEDTPLYFGNVPDYMKKALPQKYIDKISKGLAACKDRILKEESITYYMHKHHFLPITLPKLVFTIMLFFLCV